MQKTHITLTDLARLGAQMRADGEVPLRTLQERDRTVGSQLNIASPIARLKAWLDQVEPEQSRSYARVAGIEASVGLWLTLCGLVIGVLTMSGLLLVDNQRPVNVLLFLILFIGTQLLLLLLTLLVSLMLGGGHDLQLPLSYLNPARLLFRRALNRLAGIVRWESFIDVSRLALLRWGQLFGIAFNIGAALTFLVILTVTDRNFGWSSTFDMSGELLLALVNGLSSPWSWLIHSATVDLATVNLTRFQGLQTTFDASQVEAMRAWWPFLLCCIVVYGLLPRLILFGVFHRLYHQYLTRAFLHFPGVNLVLSRMDTPLVDTQARQTSPRPSLSPGTMHSTVPNKTLLAVDWVDALGNNSDQLSALGLQITSMMEAGIDLQQDQRLLDQLNQQRAPVVIAVKSWEPPLADLGDFINHLDNNIECYLLLLPLHDKPVTQAALQDWQYFVRQQSHPALTLLVGGPEDSG